MVTLSFIFIVAALLLVAALPVIYYYNAFIQLRALLEEGASGIDVQLKRRYDLIPQLVSVVKGYSLHEKSILEEVTRLRSQAATAHTLQEKSSADAGLTNALRSLFAVVESYPQLKANDNFLVLQKEIGTIEQELQLARRYYNGAARNYNSAIQQFPAHLVAQATGFEKEPYFGLTSSQEREAPRIEF